MYEASGSQEPLWRLCERAWAEWLLALDYHIEPLADAVGNVPSTRAPMIRSRAGGRRSPDILTVNPEGLTEYWEVKYRTGPSFDESTGEACFWVSSDAFDDYIAVSDRAPLWIVLFEAANAHHEGRWLRASAGEIRTAGRRDTRYGRGGRPIDAWVWPAKIMHIVDGPTVNPPAPNEPLVPDEGDDVWLDNAALMAASERQALPDGLGGAATRSVDALLDQEPQLSLAALCSRVGTSRVPQYSVTRIGDLSPDELEATLGFVEHGIRLQLIVGPDSPTPARSPRCLAWSEARLLEVATVSTRLERTGWIVDGQERDHPELTAALRQADAETKFNLDQFRIVHSDANASTAVLAGAGTGKTETMTERMVYLLATSPSRGVAGELYRGTLRTSSFAFITFTKEAAAEMRSRLDRTLLLRQRLCSRPVQPYRHWASELASTRVSTLHSFAQGLIGSFGADVGYSDTFRVSALTMPLHRLVQEALSPHLTDVYDAWPSAPAEYLWQRHVETLWAALENKAPLMHLAGPEPDPVDLGDEIGNTYNQFAVRVTNEVLEQLAGAVSRLCRDEDIVPLSQLIPLALAIVRSSPDRSIRDLEYLFVDEFQDTDEQQINLVTELARAAGARIFVVGDVKQGIYRFRGAAGDAFSQAKDAYLKATGQDLEEATLTKNFRSTPALLNDMHRFFAAWGAPRSPLLDYGQALTASRATGSADTPIEFSSAARTPEGTADIAAAIVKSWRDTDPTGAIGILCRDNRETVLIRDALNAVGIDCVTYAGGEFFRTPAVREFRSLLEAIADPTNDAALLELMETGWARGISSDAPPPSLRLSEPETESWESAPLSLVDWRSRLAAFRDGSFTRNDLVNLQVRIGLLAQLVRRTSTLNVITSVLAGFGPMDAFSGSQRQRDQYSRCLSHLVTILVDEFEGGSATLPSMLEWLRLRIATDKTEDEPVDPELVQGDRVCVALTVHKAKGLQYKRVLIPFTLDRFLREPGAERTSASVVDRRGEVKLVWRWKLASGRQAPILTNRGPSDPAITTDRTESVREETRLLYVAMTRARDQLHILRGNPSNGPTQTWTDLLEMGRVR